MIRTIARYIVTGGLSAVLNYIIFIGSIALGVHYLLAATAASVVTVIVGYFLHRNITFKSGVSANVSEFASFIGVFAVQYVIGMTGYVLLIGKMGLSPSIAFVLNNIVIVTVAFLLLNTLTFRNRAK